MKKYIHLLLILLLAASCGKKAGKTPDEQPPDVFGVTVQDKQLEFSPSIIGLKSHLNKNEVNIDTYDLIKLADLFLQSESNELKQKAFSIYTLTSKPGQTATTITSDVTPAGSSYVEQAYSFLKPFLLDKYNNYLKETFAKVDDASSKIKKPAGKEVTSSDFLQYIVGQLKIFNYNLNIQINNDQAAARFINPITRRVTDEYIEPLNDFIPALTWNRDEQKLFAYLDQLKSKVEVVPGLSQIDRITSVNQLIEAMDYAKKTEKIKESIDGFRVIVDLWLNSAVRSRTPKALVEFMRKYNDKQLLALSTDNKALLDKDTFEKLKLNKNYDLMTDLQLIAIATKNDVSIKDSKDWNELFLDNRKKFLDQTDIKKIYLDRGVDAKAGEAEKMAALTSYWLNLKIRLTLPDKLIEAFNSFESDTELEKLKDDSFWSVSLTRKKIKDFIEGYNDPSGQKPSSTEKGIENFKNYLLSQIYGTTESTLKYKIQNLALNLKSIVHDEVVAELNTQAKDFPKLVFEDFKKFAKGYLQDWFFGQNALSLFEAPNVRCQKTRGGEWGVIGFTLGQTSSRLIGAGLSFNHSQLNSDLNLKTKNIIAYQVVSKISSIAGYMDYESKPIDALMMPIIGGQNEKFNIYDIANYDATKKLFAVPDQIFLVNEFKANVFESLKSTVVSVLGQMELLNSYSKLMQWMKPWGNSSFTQTLFPLRLAEFPQQEIFPRNDLFKENLGLALSILYNLQAKMVGVFDINGSFQEGAETKNPIGAVVHDFDAKGPTKIISTFDIAQSMMAISNFYLVTEDLSLSNDKEIQNSMPRINSAREQLRSLLKGLAVFSFRNLQAEDGGFARGYDLIKQVPFDEPRSLEDQLVMQKAMSMVGALLNLNIIKLKAVNNYYFLNQKFWNAKIGFYNEYENTSKNEIKLAHLLQAFESFKLVGQTLTDYAARESKANDSLEQLNQVLSYWKTRHIAGLDTRQSVVELSQPQAPIFSP